MIPVTFRIYGEYHLGSPQTSIGQLSTTLRSRSVLCRSSDSLVMSIVVAVESVGSCGRGLSSGVTAGLTRSWRTRISKSDSQVSPNRYTTTSAASVLQRNAARTSSLCRNPIARNCLMVDEMVFEDSNPLRLPFFSIMHLLCASAQLRVL